MFYFSENLEFCWKDSYQLLILSLSSFLEIFSNRFWPLAGMISRYFPFNFIPCLRKALLYPSLSSNSTWQKPTFCRSLFRRFMVILEIFPHFENSSWSFGLEMFWSSPEMNTAQSPFFGQIFVFFRGIWLYIKIRTLILFYLTLNHNLSPVRAMADNFSQFPKSQRGNPCPGLCPQDKWTGFILWRKHTHKISMNFA